MKKRISHGISNFEKLISDNYYYIDRTIYLEKLEDIPNPYQFLLRPRKFGKSLFISLMQYYYGIEHKEKFDKLFGEYYIGKQKTPSANSMYVLKIDFSSIRSETIEILLDELLNTVRYAVEGFLQRYNLFSVRERDEIVANQSPNLMLRALFSKLAYSDITTKVCVLIDEYDHFTNELFAFNSTMFKEIVSQNGIYRKMFEAIKEATGLGVVTRLFATGVTPVTLDSMTSGFNISVDISGLHQFNEILGFTDSEVRSLLEYYEIKESESVLGDMRRYYNGSRFGLSGKEKLYNSNMVLYFMFHLLNSNAYPNPIIDKNIASDFSKISAIFSLNDSAETDSKLKEIFQSGETAAELTQQFTFQRAFTPNDLISLLYYNGLLTIKEEQLGSIIFCIPNYVVNELYWKFFAERISNQAKIVVNESHLRDAMQQMAMEGKIDSFMGIINNTMNHLSNRDLQNFDEKYVKMLFLAFASLSPLFYKKSEREVGRFYPDLLFLNSPVVPVKNQLLFEFKYLKVRDRERLEEKFEEAKSQIQRYLEIDEVREFKNLQCFAVVFIGAEGHFRKV